MLYLNHNGKVQENNGPAIHTNNRAYQYGDGVFESIRIFHGCPINLEIHYKRLIEGAELIKIRIPSYFSSAFFEEKIIELIQKSNLSEGGKCKVSLDRSSGGTYRPETNEAEFCIEVYPILDNAFILNQKGLEVDLFTEMPKTKNKLSNYKTKNGLLYILASIDAKEREMDDLLILNTDHAIIESTSSNIFVISNGVIYTPGIEDGCLAGTMRMQVINIALSNGMKVYECPITPQNLLSADEVFLTNAIAGVKWVGGYRTKRYFNTISKNIIQLLNEKFVQLTES